MKTTLKHAIILLVLAARAYAQTVTQAGFTLNTYQSGIPLGAPVAGMAIDPVTHTLFLADQDTGSPLFRIAPDHTVTNLGTFTTPSSGFYPFFSTDIQFLGNMVYSVGSSGGLTAHSATVPGNAGDVILFPGYSFECGLAAIGTTLYITGGSTTPGQLSSFNTITNIATPIGIFGLPNNASSLEYDPVSSRLYLATTSGSFFSINLQNSIATPVSSVLDGQGLGNFAVDPNGLFLYTRLGGVVERITIANGVVTPFVTGLESDSREDLVFGSSSSGGGSSLYIGSAQSVFEVQGFAAIVPEPSALAMLALGIPIIIGARWRRREA